MKKSQISNLKSQNKGFTLLETLVAVAILALVIIGPLELAARAIGYSKMSRNQITASFLAQEAMEYIRNKRDTSRQSGNINNWVPTSGLTTCNNANGCRIDVINNDVNQCTANCIPLKYDSSGGYYNYSIGQDTDFVRIIKISTPTYQEELKIEVTVKWAEKFGGKSFILTQYLYEY